MSLPRRNHNPVWIVEVAEQRKRLFVWACDERQVRDWVSIARGLTAVSVVRQVLDD